LRKELALTPTQLKAQGFVFSIKTDSSSILVFNLNLLLGRQKASIVSGRAVF